MPHVLSTMRCEKTKSDDSDSRYASNSAFDWRCRIVACASAITSAQTAVWKLRRPSGEPEERRR